MKPDFSPESQSPFSLLWDTVAHFFPSLCFPFSFSFFFSCSFSSGVRQWPKPHGRFDQWYVQRHQTSALIARRLSFFFSPVPSHASCHLSGKQTCLCCKKMLKEEKNVYLHGGKQRCERRDLGSGERMQSWRNDVSQGTSQTSLGSLRVAPVLNFNTTERKSGVRNLNRYFTCPCLLFFFFFLPLSTRLLG